MRDEYGTGRVAQRGLGDASEDQVAEAALGDCASSPATFYLVNGVEISTAFQNIADEIVNLRLMN